MFGVYHSIIYRYKILSPSRKMETVSELGYIISGIVYSIVFLLGALALYNKDKLYGGKSVIVPILLFTVFTLTLGGGLIGVLYTYILTDDPVAQNNGIKYFVAIAGILLLLGGIIVNHVLQAQGIVNIQGFQYFSSFLILEFSVMAAITVIVSKVWTLNT
jgi:hypothetical protein